MARARLDPYELGKITVKPHPSNPKQVRAQAYYRDRANVRRELYAAGNSAAAAERALKRKVAELSKTHQGGDETLNQGTPVSKAAELWVDECKRRRVRGRPLAEKTLQAYEGNVRRYILGSDLANLSISQANDVNRIKAWLADIADNNGEAAALAARKALSGVLAMAEEGGAIEVSKIARVRTPGASAGSAGAERMCRDPECDLDCGKRHSGVGKAFTPDQWLTLSDVLQDERFGLGAQDIADLVHFLFGTGVRVSEALHGVSWSDLDGHTVHVHGTKTAAANRVLTISDELADRLEDRRARLGPQAVGLIFGVTRYPTKAGKPRDVTNVVRQVTAVLTRAGMPWAGTHTFRRTVATWMDEQGIGLAEIANQLGHADVTVTARYLGRTVPPTRAASIMVSPSR